MSENDDKELDKERQGGSRHSSHRDIASKQHAKELNKPGELEDQDEPDKPNFIVDEKPKEESKDESKGVEKQEIGEIENKHELKDEVAPMKPNIPKEKSKAKGKQKSVYTNKNKNKPEYGRVENKSKRTDKSGRSGAASKKKNPVTQKPVVEAEKLGEDQVRGSYRLYVDGLVELIWMSLSGAY
jgi:hypothetical protein